MKKLELILLMAKGKKKERNIKLTVFQSGTFCVCLFL